MIRNIFKNKLHTRGESDLHQVHPDMVPYTCHYDENTILTKNGQLLQILKITGFHCETVEGKTLDLRDMVRKSVMEHIDAPDFSLWFHTVRRKHNLDPAGEYPDMFSGMVHNAWCEKNYWRDKYVNELYVTIIHAGLDISVRTPADFMESLHFKRLKSRTEACLEKSLKRLGSVVDGMLGTLEEFGATRLTIVHEETGAYSEPVQFFAKIMHLAESPMPVPLMDLSHYLASHKIAFGNNTLEVRGPTGKHFGAIFSVKEYHEVSSKAIDGFLQLPHQFIISQSLDFISSKEALKETEYQNYLLDVSGDEEFKELCGLDDLRGSNQGREVDYGKSQLTLMLIEDDLARLEMEIKRTAAQFAELGILIVREDIRLEECFWSQLPGNFSFLSRRKTINTARIAGYASLHNFPAGKQYNNHWGPAVTLFRTALGTPYFFNFHVGDEGAEDNGHTVIIGPNEAGKTALANFLLSESRKFGGRLCILDCDEQSKPFIRATGGLYGQLGSENSGGVPALQLNPLMLEDSAVYRQFLSDWLMMLLEDGQHPLTENQRIVIPAVVEALYRLPEEQRRLSLIAPLLGADEEAMVPESLRGRLAKWIGEGEYAFVFDHAEENFAWDAPVWGLDVSLLLRNKALLAPVLRYVIQRMTRQLDGSPAIFLLSEAWKLLDNAQLAPLVPGWLDEVKGKNGVVIMASSTILGNNQDMQKSYIDHAVMEKIATMFFLPDKEAAESYKAVFGLTDKEFSLLNSMQTINRHFLLKQENEALVAELNLSGMTRILALLSGGRELAAKIEAYIGESGENPDEWLPVFYEKYTA